jgi:hypothetical protein
MTRRIALALLAMLAVGACSSQTVPTLTPLIIPTQAAPAQATPTEAPTPVVSAVASAGASLDPTGILIVGPDYQLQSGSRDEAVSTAFDQALRLAEQGNPNDLGYPWIDPSTGGLVVSAATARGRALLESTSFGVSVRIRDVTHSTTELQKIQDDATRLHGQGVTDAVLIYETGPDFRDNRTWITIARFSRPLLDELARRFPPDALIVVVDPTRYPLLGTTTP